MATHRVKEWTAGDNDSDVVFGYVETVVDSGDFEAASTSDTVAMTGFPANAFPLYGAFNVAEYFTGGGVTAAVMELGDTGDPNGQVDQLNVFGTTTKGSWTVGTLGVESEYGSTGCVLESAYAPVLKLTTTTANCADLTAGHLTARLYYKRYAIK